MEQTMGRILLQDGTVIANNLPIFFEEIRSVRKDWQGSFTLPSDVLAIDVGSYRLELDDGRRAAILVEIGGGPKINFKGDGSPPR